MNKVALVGNIVADPKQTLTSNGNEKSSFTIAIKDCKNFQETYFIPCIAWKPFATFINTNVKKGDLVSIDGRLTRRSYTSNNQMIYITEVVVDGFETLKRRSLTNNNQISDVFNNESKLIDNNSLENSTNLDTVFDNDICLDNNSQSDNQNDSDNDNIDWDSEFN